MEGELLGQLANDLAQNGKGKAPRQVSTPASNRHLVYPRYPASRIVTRAPTIVLRPNPRSQRALYLMESLHGAKHDPVALGPVEHRLATPMLLLVQEVGVGDEGRQRVRT